jgi:hypothetical protein
MNTEPGPNDDRAQAQHRALFKRVCGHLIETAYKLQNTTETPRLDAIDVAKAYMVTVLGILLPRLGDGGTADYLRQSADAIDRGDDVQTMN